MLVRAPHSRPVRAVAAVEFALVLPFVVAILLGTFEVSRVILVKETLSNAAQRGARTGSQPGATNSQVTDDAADVLTAASITGYTVSIKVNDVAGDVTTATRGDKVSVQISVPVSQVFWVSMIFISGSTVESETVVMMRQG